jgi:preprotein translocase subunit YajC
MLKLVKPGDKVITSGGMVGTVVSVKERTLAIRSAETKVEVLKSAITEITERAGEGAPVAVES